MGMNLIDGQGIVARKAVIVSDLFDLGFTRVVPEIGRLNEFIFYCNITVYSSNFRLNPLFFGCSQSAG